MSLHTSDVASEVLIADILEQDLRALLEGGAREEETCCAESAADSTGQLSDLAVALALMAADARVCSDAAYAQSLQHSDDAASVASRQYAQQLLATEKRIALDVEFARRLQQLEERGCIKPGDHSQDIETVLGKRDIDQILADNPNEKGKGKAKALVYVDEPDSSPAKRLRVEDDDSDEPASDVEPQEFIPLSMSCGICFEEVQLVHSPVNACNVHAAASSTKLPFGISMPCPQAHTYCHACIVQYIISRIDPMGDGKGSPDVIVFPIPCPECPFAVWDMGITDDVASRVLSEEHILLWHEQKLLDSVPRIYCPNKRCSALIRVTDPEAQQVQCSECKQGICIRCRAVWHENLTCEAYQALHPDERSPEDLQTLQLMRENKWRRCPECKFIVELAHGCNHIRCRCGTEFCFKCGAKWDVVKSKCGRANPSCDMWDENMLLAEEERQGDEVLRPAVPNDAPPPRGQVNQQLHVPHPRHLQWMMTANVPRAGQAFSRDMTTSFRCGYCRARLRSRSDLRYHLSHVKRHAVYACCGEFYRHADELEEHLRADVYHRNTVHR